MLMLMLPAAAAVPDAFDLVITSASAAAVMTAQALITTDTIDAPIATIAITAAAITAAAVIAAAVAAGAAFSIC